MIILLSPPQLHSSPLLLFPSSPLRLSSPLSLLPSPLFSSTYTSLQALSLIFLIYIAYQYYKCQTTPIKLYFVPTEGNNQLLQKCQILYDTPTYKKSPDDGAVSTSAKYSPPFWLMSVHAHTIWAAYPFF